jgi:hypothetical protein
VEKIGKSDERRVIEGHIMFPGKPEGFFGKKGVNELC